MGDTPKRLGNLAAENDLNMLEHAFLETPDYLTLIESNEKVLVVGRRGTGKSALTYKLEKDWGSAGHEVTKVFKFAPEEDQVIGLRPILNKYGNKYELIRAAVKIAWETVLYLEMLNSFSFSYRFSKCDAANKTRSILKKLYTKDKNIAYNFRKLLKIGLEESDSPEEAIAELSEKFNLNTLKDCTNEFLKGSSFDVKILIDCLDEGYQPDVSGIAYISGVIQATLAVNTRHDKVRLLLFIRDNMFRAVEDKDPDYTRNIEGSSLRLHWGEKELLYLTSLRLRVAFSLEIEKDIKAWNACTTGEIKERSGFRSCLRLTLYRPRDLLALLNQAFYLASRNNSNKISDADIKSTAEEISQTRLKDLIKEYKAIFPSLGEVISEFKGFKPIFVLSDIKGRLQTYIDSTSKSKDAQRDVVFYDKPEEILKSLHSIGFLGIKDSTTEVYSFSHDGKDQGLKIEHDTIFHIHPCYQIALNLTEQGYSKEDAEEIHDDYDIHVSSLSKEQRTRKVGQLISKLMGIDQGRDDAAEFEDWCLEAIKMIFAGDLQNIHHHPNKSAPQRRDIVGTNTQESRVWKRVFDDYKTRLVLFEIKNYAELKADDYRQIASYLTDKHGEIGFIIYRSDKKEPCNENELVWIREIYWKSNPKKMIVLLSYKHLVTFLEKIRNPQKHDAVDKILGKILDNYHNIYLNEKSGSKKSKNKRKRH